MSAPPVIGQRAAQIRPLVAAALDASLVLVFAAIGRASHSEQVLPGLLRTAWPFLAALAIGSLIVRQTQRPTAGVRAGFVVWSFTVAGGMVLRALTGQGTAMSFIVVASIVLGAFLVGWRLVASRVRPASG